MTAMSKSDRNNLERLARKRASVAKANIAERTKVLRAEVEDMLTAEHKFDAALWADVNNAAARAVAEADRKIAAKCLALGIPENLRPSITIGWQNRGENHLKERRAELRRLAHARIEAAAESAKRIIESNLLDVETALITDGLETADALAFLTSMPTPEQLMPGVALDQITDGPRPDDAQRYSRGWEPPIGVVGELLNPTTATSREAKRLSIAAALASAPEASNREVARMAGVDHHTVAAVRGELAGNPPISPPDSPVDGGNS